jgi:hypothetical protein
MADMEIIMVLFGFLADTALSLLEVRLFTITVVAGMIEMAVVTINAQLQGDTIATIQTDGLAITHVITRAIQATGVALTAQVDLASIRVT